MLSTIAKSTLILHKLNVQKIYASVSVPLLAGRPNSEITTVIFPLSAPVITLLKKRRKSLVLKRELRDAQDALDVLKKAIGILGKD